MHTGEDIFWALVGLVGLYWFWPAFVLIFKFFTSLIGLDFA
jgi:hypothetical protein